MVTVQQCGAKELEQRIQHGGVDEISTGDSEEIMEDRRQDASSSGAIYLHPAVALIVNEFYDGGDINSVLL